MVGMACGFIECYMSDSDDVFIGKTLAVWLILKIAEMHHNWWQKKKSD